MAERLQVERRRVIDLPFKCLEVIDHLEQQKYYPTC